MYIFSKSAHGVNVEVTQDDQPPGVYFDASFDMFILPIKRGVLPGSERKLQLRLKDFLVCRVLLADKHI